LRKNYRLRVFKNRELRKILPPKRDRVTGKWRKLQNKEILYVQPSPNKTRMINSRRVR
jgi:hypothetical protein